MGVALGALVLAVRSFVGRRKTEEAAAVVVARAEEAISVGGLPFDPGSGIGGYHITERLGEGTTTLTLLGRDETGFPHVIKVLKTRYLSQPEVVERFRREGRILERIAHPNVVKLEEKGVCSTREGEVPYLVLEFLEGQPLDRVVREQAPLPPEKALEVAEGLARALVAAHQGGVIHRNLKPKSVFLTSRGEVKLLNFGVAKALDMKSLTQLGSAVGTLHYMAPEQLTEEPVDQRADLYALGIILYELLTGRDAYEASTFPKLLRKKQSEPPPDPCEANPSVPRPLGDLVCRLLAPSPDDRPASAQEVLEEIQRLRGPAPG